MPRADMDEIERLLGEAEQAARDGRSWHAIGRMCAAVRLLAARPAPAGGAGETALVGSYRPQWARWATAYRDRTGELSGIKAEDLHDAFRAGWAAARAADAARGERTDGR